MTTTTVPSPTTQTTCSGAWKPSTRCADPSRDGSRSAWCSRSTWCAISCACAQCVHAMHGHTNRCAGHHARCSSTASAAMYAPHAAHPSRTPSPPACAEGRVVHQRPRLAAQRAAGRPTPARTRRSTRGCAGTAQRACTRRRRRRTPTSAQRAPRRTRWRAHDARHARCTRRADTSHSAIEGASHMGSISPFFSTLQSFFF